MMTTFVFNRSDPAKMRTEIEGLPNLIQAAIPCRSVGNHPDFVRTKWDEVQFVNLEAVLQQSEFSPIEAHERSGDAIQGNRMGAGEDHTAGFWIRRHRSVAFTRNDAVHHRQITQRLLAWPTAAIEKEKAFVQVEHHAPASVVAVPVAGTNHFLRVAKNKAASFF